MKFNKLSFKDFKKFPIEIILIVILVSLLYTCPYFLKKFVSNSLGKVILLVLVILITHCYGINSGIISSLILLLLLHNVVEGMENEDDDDNADVNVDAEDIQDDDTNDKSNINDDDTNGDNEINSDDDDDTDTSHNNLGIKVQSDLLELNPGDPRNLKGNIHIPNLDAITNKPINKNEPMAMPSKKSKNNKEGFALLN